MTFGFLPKEAVGAKRRIAEFHKQNPEAPKRISAAAYAALFDLLKTSRNLLNEHYLIGH